MIAPASLSGTMSEFLRYRALHQGAPVGSVEQYERTYRSLLAYSRAHRMPDRPSALTGSAVRGWMMDELERGVSARTMSSRVAHVVSLGDYLVRQKLLAENPARGIEPPRFESGRRSSCILRRSTSCSRLNGPSTSGLPSRYSSTRCSGLANWRTRAWVTWR